MPFMDDKIYFVGVRLKTRDHQETILKSAVIR